MTSYTSTQLTFQESPSNTLTYVYDPQARTLTRRRGGLDTVLLEQCDFLNFHISQRNPSNAFTFYPATSPDVANGNTVAAMRVCNSELATPAQLPWPGRIDYQPPAMGVQGGGGVGTGGDVLYQGKPGLQMQYLGLTPEGTGFLYRVNAFAYGGNADTAAVVQSIYKLTSAVRDLGTE